MKTFKPLMYDVLIILLFLAGIACYCFDIHFNIVRLFVGICYVIVFPVAIRNTGIDFKKVRYKAIEYAVSFMIAFPVALKITEIVRDKTLSVDPLTVVLTGVCLHSIFYVCKYHKLNI